MREAQIVYAATDAHCLIEVYDKLTENCYSYGIDFPPKSVRVRGVSNNQAKKAAVAEKREKAVASTPGSSRNGSAATNGAEVLQSSTFSAGEAATNGFHDVSSEEPSTSVPEEIPSPAIGRQASFETDSLTF